LVGWSLFYWGQIDALDLGSQVRSVGGLDHRCALELNWRVPEFAAQLLQLRLLRDETRAKRLLGFLSF
jgi:hypothetical protein